MEAFRHYLTLPFLLEGMWLTLRIFVAAMAGGLLLGLLVALMRLSAYRVLSGAAWLYVWLLRGTPVLLQLVFLFDALPLVAQAAPTISLHRCNRDLLHHSDRSGWGRSPSFDRCP